MSELADFVPRLRDDLLRETIDDAVVAWSPVAPEPVALDPVSGVMLDVIDGDASVGQLAREVHEEVGIDAELAMTQVTRTVELFGAAGLLTDSESDTSAAVAIAERELFANPCLSCTANAARTMTVTDLRFEDTLVSVAIDARRGTKRLVEALGSSVVVTPESGEGDVSDRLGFVLTAPSGFQRTHRLIDRSGFVLSETRGLDAGLHALGAHLTAFLPPAPGSVRLRASVALVDGRVVLCLFPLMLVPSVDESDWSDGGVDRVDRLAVDVDVATGELVEPASPWPELEAMGSGPAHAGRGVGGRVDAVIAPLTSGASVPTPATVAAVLASQAIAGLPGDVLAASSRLAAGARLTTVDPVTGLAAASVRAAVLYA